LHEMPDTVEKLMNLVGGGEKGEGKGKGGNRDEKKRKSTSIEAVRDLLGIYVIGEERRKKKKKKRYREKTTV